MKILIIYQSAAGSTKLIANFIHTRLKSVAETDITSVERLELSTLPLYDAFVIGFPTYHTSPSKSILNMLNSMSVFDSKKPTYLYTTCGLYSANSVRIFAKKCIRKNIIPVVSASYRCPASDGVLYTPSMDMWLNFENNWDKKVDKAINRFLIEIKKEVYIQKIPRFKLYSILNYPNKLAGKYLAKPKIYIDTEKCIKCGRCVNDCSYHCLTMEVGVLSYHGQDCEHCFRCIHHCPVKALSIKKRKNTVRQLDDKFFIDKQYESKNKITNHDK